MVDVEYKPGTLEEAQLISYGQNAAHGLQRTNEDKRRAVENAIFHPLLLEASDAEIAKICAVSKSFVGAVRRPEIKKQQKENIERHYSKKVNKNNVLTDDFNVRDEGRSSTTDDGALPNAAELEEAELVFQADLEAMNMILASDEKLKDAHDEIKRLNVRVAQLEMINKGLQNERNAAVSQAKFLKNQLDKIIKREK
jgi:outer membrane murein-binding lipoprotein Lpp